MMTSPISLGTFSYFLVYGKGAILSPNIYLLSLLLAQSTSGKSSNFIQFWINALLKLEDKRNKAKGKSHVYTSGNKQFQVGDLMLKWNKPSKARGKHSKFQNIWLGLYVIIGKIGDSIYSRKPGKPPYQCISPKVIIYLTTYG